jgi:hypothetical protein
MRRFQFSAVKFERKGATMKIILVSLIACVGLLQAGAVTAQSFEAVILPIENLAQASLGTQKAKVQDSNIDALVEKIYAVIKPSFPSRTPVALSLQGLSLDSFKRLMKENTIAFRFNEVRIKDRPAGVVGIGGKGESPESSKERIAVKTDGAFETGRNYEAMLSKEGYENVTANFAVVRSGNGNAVEFGDTRLSMTPSNMDTVGFLIDVSDVALDAGKQAALRARIGEALDKEHHALRWYSEETLDAVLKAAGPPDARIPAANAAAQQAPARGTGMGWFAALKYIIKLE